MSWQDWKTLWEEKYRRGGVCSTQVTTHSGGFQICEIPLEVRSWTMTVSLSSKPRASSAYVCIPGKVSARAPLPANVSPLSLPYSATLRPAQVQTVTDAHISERNWQRTPEMSQPGHHQPCSNIPAATTL